MAMQAVDRSHRSSRTSRRTKAAVKYRVYTLEAQERVQTMLKDLEFLDELRGDCDEC